MATHIPLDEYAQDALADWVALGATIRDAEAARNKARDVLISFFRQHGADTGTVNDIEVCRLIEEDREILDPAKLREAEPLTFRRYAKLSHREYIRTLGGAP